MSKKEKKSAPMELMLTISEKGDSDKVVKYLAENNIHHNVIMMAKGTNTSHMADLFTFGIDDRDILATFIPTGKKDEIVKNVTDILGLEKDNLGLVMIVDINSATSTLLEKLEYKI